METILKGEKNTIPEKELETFKIEFKETVPVNINVGEITVMDATETPNIKQSSPHLSNKQSTKKSTKPMQIKEGIYGAVDIYSRYSTMLNVVAQCFRAIYLMTKGITNESRRKELRIGFELHRIPKEISKDMSPEDQDKMHITPSEEERQFAKNYLIKEAQRQTYPDEYRRLKIGESI